MAEPHDDVSHLATIVPCSKRLLRKSHAAKRVISPVKPYRPWAKGPEPKVSSPVADPNLAPPKSLDTPANVPPSDPPPVADPPPTQDSISYVPPSDPPRDASEPKTQPPNNPKTPAYVGLPNPAPALQPQSSGRNRAKRKISTTMPPPRRSSRLNKSVSNPTESALDAADNSEAAAAVAAETVAKKAAEAAADASSHEESSADEFFSLNSADNSDHDDVPEDSLAAADSTTTTTSGCSTASPPILEDDGSRRFQKRVSLRECPEAREASGEDLDWSSSKVLTRKRKRIRNKNKSDVRCGRGPGQPRDPVHPDSRPKLKIVGDREFTSEPECTKIITTIRVATCECLPGPIRSFNMFPTRVRLQILRKFLQRYSWADGEDVGLCLDVFERIAADAYSRVLVQTRKNYTNKISDDKEQWKEFCPPWCQSLDHWKGLCNIFKNPNWEKSSTINRNNKLVHGKGVASHVGGSRSSYRHKMKLIAEKGPSIDLKDVFDRTHFRKSSNGYVNDRAKDAANDFKALKESHGKGLADEVIWDMAVKGEDKRGRLYGFGIRSRKSRANRELEAMEASVSPTKSTATSSKKKQKVFTTEEVEALLKDTLAAAEKGFAEKIAEVEKRHNAEREADKEETLYRKMCLDELSRRTGFQPPQFPVGTSTAEAPGGSRGNQEGGEEGNQEGREEP